MRKILKEGSSFYELETLKDYEGVKDYDTTLYLANAGAEDFIDSGWVLFNCPKGAVVVWLYNPEEAWGCCIIGGIAVNGKEVDELIIDF